MEANPAGTGQGGGEAMSFSDRLQRHRVALGWVFAGAFLVLARPTPPAIAVGALFFVIGAVIRTWAAGHIRKREVLAVTGPYAHTRNPLYFGSCLMACGALIMGRNWWLAGGVSSDRRPGVPRCHPQGGGAALQPLRRGLRRLHARGSTLPPASCRPPSQPRGVRLGAGPAASGVGRLDRRSAPDAADAGPLVLDFIAVRGPAETEVIHRFLDRLRLRLAVAATARALFQCLAVARRRSRPEHPGRRTAAGAPWVAFALAAAGTLGLAVAAVRFFLAMARPSRRAAARRVQAVEPGLRNDVESSLDLASLLTAPVAGVSSPLVGALVASTGERLAAASPRRFVSWRGGRRRGAAAGGGCGPAGGGRSHRRHSRDGGRGR